MLKRKALIIAAIMLVVLSGAFMTACNAGETADPTEELPVFDNVTDTELLATDAVTQTDPTPTEEISPETKPVETKPVETKPVETKPAEAKPTQTQPKQTESAPTAPDETQKPAEENTPKETKPIETEPPATTLPETQPVPTEPTESRETEPTVSQYRAPDFTVYDTAGNPVRLSDYFGKPVVLNFWASWCGPCKREMPEFQSKYDQYSGQVHFLMVNVTGYDTQEDAKAYIETSGYTFPVLYDINLDATNTYGIGSFPTTFFIDANGDLVTYAVGALSAAALQQGIDMIR